MPATDQRSTTDADEPVAAEGRTEARLGTDPGEPEEWEIIRVHCPECDRPIALIGDEERLPQHAVLPTAWHPFSASVCLGSGAPTEDLMVCDSPDDGAGPGLAALLTLPAELDWRTQPFSHPAGPGSAPLNRVPAQRTRLARR